MTNNIYSPSDIFSHTLVAKNWSLYPELKEKLENTYWEYIKFGEGWYFHTFQDNYYLITDKQLIVHLEHRAKQDPKFKVGDKVDWDGDLGVVTKVLSQKYYIQFPAWNGPYECYEWELKEVK
jgi:hypothetical protein